MTNIVTHNYQGFAISQRETNGYVSLTDMAKASGKMVGHYLALDSTKEYLEALSADIAIPISALVKVSKGGNCEQGTWAYPEIAIDFASWCNVQFRVWANRTLHRGVVQSEVQIKSAINQVKLQIEAVRLEILQAKLSKLSARKAKLVQQNAITFNESIAQWADVALRHESGAKIYIGNGRKEDTLSYCYEQYCQEQNLKAVRFQRFSSELLKYLIHNKQWDARKLSRDSFGTPIANISFI